MLSKENTKEQVADDQSRLIRMQEDTLLSSSQQMPIYLDLPKGFTIGKAIGGGDCFFDAVAQGLKQLKPEMNFTVKSLRKICKKQALDKEKEIKEKIIKDARNCVKKEDLPSPSVSDNNLWDAYLASIEYTAEDVTKIGTQKLQLYESLTHLKYGKTLQVPIWGRPEIEGRLICKKYNVKLHVIESNPWYTYDKQQEPFLHQLIDDSGSKNIGRHDKVDYNDGSVLHIINGGYSHFEPILRKVVQQILHYSDLTQIQNRFNDLSFKDNQMDCETSVGVLPAGSERVATCGDCFAVEVQSDTKFNTSNAGIANYKVIERATSFVKIFVEKFEKKLLSYLKEAEPDSNIQKISKVSAKFSSALNNTIPPSPLKLFIVKVNESINHYSTGKRHKKGAENIFAITTPYYKDSLEILVKAGLEIFYRFEEPFIKAIDINSFPYQRRVEELAIDAVHRIMNYLFTSKEQDFSVDLITQGVVLGKSKKKEGFTRPGYEIKDEKSGKSLVTSELYEWIGIKKEEEDETVNYYQYDCEEHDLEGYGYAEKYGYRLPFEWELRNWEEVKQKYVSSETPIERYVYILDDEKKEKLARLILKEINESNPVTKKDIEDVMGGIKKQDKNICQSSFNFGQLPELFLEREKVLYDLIEKLNSQSQEYDLSRVVLISGDSGVGKSELARSCGLSQRHCNAWVKIMWIDASSNINLLSSFSKLAKRLAIPVQGVQGQERKTKSIVEDIYKYLQDTKSFFVFDNASNYEEIEKFLPFKFSCFSNREKPFIVITSSNTDWGIKGLREVKLGDFTREEGSRFIQKTLGNNGSDNDSLLQKVGCSPLSLASAVGFIKREGLTIKDYLKKYKVTQQSNPNLFKVKNSNENLLGIFSINIDGIKEEKNIGQQSYDILVFMAYMDSHQIDAVKIFSQGKLKEDKQKIQDALVRLNNYSAIHLNKRKTIAKIHKKVQEIVRLRQKKEGKEEEVLKKIMTSLIDNKCENISHIISVWNYASKYEGLVDEFIESDYDGSNILHFLAQDDNKEVIKLILEKVNPSKLSRIINATDKTEMTSLSYAISYGYLELVEYFIEKGAIDYSMCPLNRAAFNDQLKIVQYFIDDIDYQCDSGVLCYAIAGNSLDVVKYCVEEKKIDINLKDYLHRAVQNGHLDIVKYLARAVININQKDKYGATPLHYAFKGNYLDIAHYLMENNADITLEDEHGYNVLHFATFNVILNFIVPTKLQQRINLKTLSFTYVADPFSLRNVQYLIGTGIDVNSRDKNRMTLVHYAAEGGNLDTVQYLVQEGANVNLYDNLGRNSLNYAAINGHLSIVQYLVQEGANVNSHDNLGRSPLYYATKNGYVDVVSDLERQLSAVNPVHEQSQRKRQRVLELQDCTLPYSVNDQCVSSKRGRLENVRATSLDNQESVNPSLDTTTSLIALEFKLQHVLNRYDNKMQRFTQLGNGDSKEPQQPVENSVPISSLSGIVIEPGNNKVSVQPSGIRDNKPVYRFQ